MQHSHAIESQMKYIGLQQCKVEITILLPITHIMQVIFISNSQIATKCNRI